MLFYLSIEKNNNSDNNIFINKTVNEKLCQKLKNNLNK